MPYYCTVPRCTSMAGKAKNVSFHQFPRDEELAKLWNDILKRGKPYTKYSKVCSLHFKPEDYTITSAGKNKGQWRTLRKDAIPSQNLPSDTPAPYQRRQSSPWISNTHSNLPTIDPQIQQQFAQAIYVQTMLALQAARPRAPAGMLSPHIQEELTQEEPTQEEHAQEDHTQEEHTQEEHTQEEPECLTTNTSTQQNELSMESECDNDNHSDTSSGNSDHNENTHFQQFRTTEDNVTTSYKCDDCSKCFKDPDVFVLHKRSHKSERNGLQTGKENFDLNSLKPETLRSNPILANLLKNTVEKNIINTNLFERQLMVSFSSLLRGTSSNEYHTDCDSINDTLDDNNLVIDENVA